MRWNYKTTHFNMKKEGLLGNAFLDEAEIEATLNEFGTSGWELVSLMEVTDGLIAVFKQPSLKDLAPVCETVKGDESKRPLNTVTDMPMKKVSVSPPVIDSVGSDSRKDEDVGAIKIM